MADSFSVTCTSSQNNTGEPRCGDDMGYPKKFVFVPRGTEFATEAAAKVLANWTTLINSASADRAYPFPVIFKSEPAADEPVYEDGLGGQSIFVALKAGKSKYQFTLNSICYAKKLQSFNDNTWAVFIITSTGKILGVTDSTGLKFQPQNCVLRVDSPILPTDTTTGKIPITLQMVNPALFNTNGVVLDPSATFDPETQLLGIQDVYLTGATPTATTWAVTVKTRCDNVAVSGLVAGDFTVLKGVTPVSVTAAETADGVYTLTYSTQSGDLTCQLKNQPDMTTNGYEDAGIAITGSIPA